MSDYISKSVLLEKIDDLPRDYGRLDDSDVLDEIERAPTVDAVPVVRCGECKYFDPSDNQCYRPRYTEDDVCDAEPNGGCTYGRRKGGEK